MCVTLQSGVVDKQRLMLLLNLFYNKLSVEVKNSVASPRRCTFSAYTWISVCDFITRDSYSRPICYSAYMSRQFRVSVPLSARPSVTRVICIKTAERIIEILSSSDRPIILVFRHQGSLRTSDLNSTQLNSSLIGTVA